MSFNFRTLTEAEYQDFRKAGEVCFHLGMWSNTPSNAPVALYNAEWNSGRPFVVSGDLFSTMKPADLVDGDGKVKGTEELPEPAPAPVEQPAEVSNENVDSGVNGAGEEGTEEEASPTPEGEESPSEEAGPSSPE